MYIQESNEKNNIQVDDIAKSDLLETARWANFLSIMGFIVVGICFFAGIIAVAINPQSSTYESPMSLRFAGIECIIIAAVIFYPCFALNRFAVKMKTGFKLSDKEEFNAGISFLKGAFRYQGILTIIYLFLVVIIVFFAVVMGVALHH